CGTGRGAEDADPRRLDVAHIGDVDNAGGGFGDDAAGCADVSGLGDRDPAGAVGFGIDAVGGRSDVAGVGDRDAAVRGQRLDAIAAVGDQRAAVVDHCHLFIDAAAGAGIDAVDVAGDGAVHGDAGVALGIRPDPVAGGRCD